MWQGMGLLATFHPFSLSLSLSAALFLFLFCFLDRQPLSRKHLRTCNGRRPFCGLMRHIASHRIVAAAAENSLRFHYVAAMSLPHAPPQPRQQSAGSGSGSRSRSRSRSRRLIVMFLFSVEPRHHYYEHRYGQQLYIPICCCCLLPACCLRGGGGRAGELPLPLLLLLFFSFCAFFVFFSTWLLFSGPLSRPFSPAVVALLLSGSLGASSWVFLYDRRQVIVASACYAKYPVNS